MDFKKYIGMRWADIADMEDEENFFVDQNKLKKSSSKSIRSIFRCKQQGWIQFDVKKRV